jgi:hypothetical protein
LLNPGEREPTEGVRAERDESLEPMEVVEEPAKVFTVTEYTEEVTAAGGTAVIEVAELTV